jgi:hypothetical protein
MEFQKLVGRTQIDVDREIDRRGLQRNTDFQRFETASLTGG